MWNRHRALSHDHTFRNDLNSSLRSEVDLFMNREILSSNSMFSKVSDSVLIAIVSTLQNQVFLEGDYIIRKGQWGEEMYFILSGKAGARINGKIVKTYVRGSSFGEIALIEDGGRRKCDVMALTNVDMRIFTRTDFDVLGHRYPELHARLKSQARAYSSNFKSKSRFKSATTMLAKNGVAGLFSKTEAPDGPMGAKKNAALGGIFGKKAKAGGLGGGLFGGKKSVGVSGVFGKKVQKDEDENADKLAPLPAIGAKKGAFNPSRKRFTITAEPDSAAIARLDQLADSDGKATSTSPRSSEVDMAMLAALERLNQQLTSLETRVDKWQKESTAQFTELSKTVKTLATRK
jgi:CRP-like cAMP-binding protein